jgi:hypothetical protein
VAARWEKTLNPMIVKGAFTPDEDRQICCYVSMNGPHNWAGLTEILPHRSSKQCRERWFNHLDPNIQKLPWSEEEDTLIYQQFRLHGGRWSVMAKLLPGRTDNAIKNRFHSSISKRIKYNSNGEEFLVSGGGRLQPPKEKPPEIMPRVPHEVMRPQIADESQYRRLPPLIQAPNLISERNTILESPLVSEFVAIEQEPIPASPTLDFPTSPVNPTRDSVFGLFPSLETSGEKDFFE